MYFDSNMTDFNSGWQFLPPQSESNVELATIPSGTESVTLPHAWNDMGWNYEEWKPDKPAGTGYYYKVLDKLESQVPAVKFEGISALSEIFLNGTKVGENIGAHTAFTIQLDNLRSDGSDLLVIKVTDKASLPELDPSEASGVFQTSPRYKNWPIPLGSSKAAGGIWRNTWLLQDSRNTVEHLKIESFMDMLAITPEATGTAAGDTIDYELIAPDGTLVATASGTGSETVTIQLDNALAWHPRNPQLYQLKAVRAHNGEKVQTIEQKTAFREFTVRDSEFYVNGKPYMLRGQNGFSHANIPHDREYIQKFVAAVKAQGVEISRFHTEPPSHAWLDECDRQGIMVIFEMAIHGSMGCYPFDHPIFRRNAEAEMLSLIKEYRRHPSISLWCLGNEMIVGCERDIGLTAPLFDVLNEWIAHIREVDPRPVVSNSGGDGVDLCQTSVGDVDDVHQYGGWYVETLGDLRNYTKFSRKNDMVFQPMIVTESVAAYNDDEGKFFAKGSDTRQKKVTKQRLGSVYEPGSSDVHTQAFILKEYAEQMWRLRDEDSNFGGYIPFGQYTWFSRPFDKSPDGIKPKPIWDVYRMTMGPVHVQLDCFDRNLNSGGNLNAVLRVYNEDIMLPEKAEFHVDIRQGDTGLTGEDFVVEYHQHIEKELSMPLANNCERIKIAVICKGQVIAENYLDIKIYQENAISSKPAVALYDPSGRLNGLTEIANVTPLPRDLSQLKDMTTPLVIGPFAYDRWLDSQSETIIEWCMNGGKVIVLEQNPDWLTENMFGTGVGVMRQTQPHWSRWAANLVRHFDRTDILCPDNPAFRGIEEADLARWNGDTFIAHSALKFDRLEADDHILLSTGNGLADSELMPVQHPDLAPNVSVLMAEKHCGSGSIVFCQLLAGSKFRTEPATKLLLKNLLNATI